MKKRKLALGMAMAVCMMSSISVSAAIDMSVFESKTDMYEIEIDDFDDTGTITLLDEEGELKNVSSHIKDGEDFSKSADLYVTFDIRIINDGELAVPRIMLLYYGEDWIFTDTVIMKDDEKRFTFEIDAVTDTYDGKVLEGVDLILGSEGIQLLEQIAKGYEKNIEEYGEDTTLIDFLSWDGRLSGSKGDVDFSFTIYNASRLAQFYYDFVEAGGLEQDLDIVTEEFPCVIKEMN